MMGNIAAIQAHISVLSGDFPHAIENANLAIRTLPKSSLFPCSVAHWALGIGNYLDGDIEIARHSCAEVVKLGRAMDNVWTTVTGLTDLASVHQIQGQLGQTATLCREALQLATEHGAQSLGYMGRVEAKLADVLYEQNELAAAKNYLTDSIEKINRWTNPNHFVYSYCLLALVLRAQGNLKGTFDALMKADHIRGKFPILPVLDSMLEKCNVRLWLSQKNMKRIEHWAKENDIYDVYRNDASFKIPKDREQLLITLARVFITQDKADEALDILKHLGGYTESEKRIGALIEILILQAQALQAQNNTASALKVLGRALALAEPGGYVRVFVDEGPSIAGLLEKLLDRKSDVPRAYIKKLLSAFRLNKMIKADDGLVELLSERELEVVRLISAGLSNKKITEALFISMSTVKTHLRNIYHKLNVHSRTEAIAKTKELELL
jgi:LuxR family maltose regulon positive regulatory protein